MRPRSAGFDEAVANSHRLAVSASVITPTGEQPIEILDGSVTLDATAASRGRLDFTATVADLPSDPTDLLAPYGNEIRVRRGVIYPDGSVELVGLGVFRIQSSEVSDSGGEMTVRVSGIDRSIRIIEAVFEELTWLGWGLPINETIEALIREVYPDVVTNFATTSLLTPVRFAPEGSNRWDTCEILAEAMGCALYFDGDGEAALRPVPTGVSEPVAYLEEGEGGVLLSASKSWSREDAINRVVVNGTGGEAGTEGAAPRGVAIDDNALSPTRYGGPFGRATFTYDSEWVTEDNQAENAAEVILAQKLGTSASLSVEALVNPAIEPYDVVQITRERAGIAQESHILDSVTHPLGPDGTMSANTRAALIQ